MRTKATTAILLVVLMGLVLPVQAGENSEHERLVASREANQATIDRESEPTPERTEPTAPAVRAEQTKVVQTKVVIGLTGAAEVPADSGDPDGKGRAGLRIRVSDAGLCYFIRVMDIDTVVAAHIHEGGVDVDGPVVLDLAITEAETVTRGETTAYWQCLSELDETLLTNIEANLGDYYLNVHTTAFPDGAVRGQLNQTSSSSH